MPDTCISLSGSTQCRAYSKSSVSTSSKHFSDFPFMQNVSTVEEFDKALHAYLLGPYVKQKYVNYLGCQSANLTDTDEFYARYTASAACNGLIQSSKSDCDLSDDESRPLCADTCAQMATSEQEIVVNSELCPGLDDNYMDQIRSDFTVCALPADSLTGSCISGEDNEPDSCGFGPNLMGLCSYCSSSSSNSTDSCCKAADSATRCESVTVPTTTGTLPPVVTTPSSTAGAGAVGSSHGLSGGQIAGIVVGSVAGFALLVAILVCVFMCLRRRRKAQSDGGLNQPNPQRKGATPSISEAPERRSASYAPGSRVTRMAALREMPSIAGVSRSRIFSRSSGKNTSSTSDTDSPNASPGRMSKRIPPVTGKRDGSLASSSAVAGTTMSDASPRSGTAGNLSSPGGGSSGRSEQMSAFQDYYSKDSIHPGDRVAVLWAYQPRAGDEFTLDRGDMLKIIGIWDDGWATGVRLSDHAENYDFTRRAQRDSGVSNGENPVSSPAPTGDIKAFPLVCVCLPQHWRGIIDGASPDDDDDNGTAT